MEPIKTYLLRLTAAAIACGIAMRIAKDKKLSGALARLLCGVVMTLVLLSPLINLQGTDIFRFSGSYADAANAAAENGKLAAADAWAAGIKQAAEAYILDKAEIYDANIAVEVSVCSGQPPVPASVRIVGRISPYGKKMLSQQITQDLGIAEEDQIWTN